MCFVSAVAGTPVGSNGSGGGMADERKEQPDLSARISRYANAFNIGHNAFEFVLEFGQQLSEEEEVAMHTRIVTHPIYARALHASLGDSLLRYESEFGWCGHALPDESAMEPPERRP
jgi:hypothetical protein